MVALSLHFSHQQPTSHAPTFFLSFRPPATPLDSFGPSGPLESPHVTHAVTFSRNRSPTTNCTRGFSQPTHVADSWAPQVLIDHSREVLRAFAHISSSFLSLQSASHERRSKIHIMKNRCNLGGCVGAETFS
jgi:hypothetical protein